MKIISNSETLRKTITRLKKQGRSIGFVPTMGALHQGHLSLIRKCRKQNDIVVLSIFVNPTQFGPHEDFKKYPRTQKKDIAKAKKEGVNLIFCPKHHSIYKKGHDTYVEVKDISSKLCGKTRPGHFRGVATIVTKLLNIVTPDKLYLGQKDAQQCFVIKRIISDLNFKIKVVMCPIIRETDGLAMSSRNAYLTKKQRKQATILYQSLKLARNYCKHLKEKKASKIIRDMRRLILKKSCGRIEYIVCLDAKSFNPVKTVRGRVYFLLAVKFGQTRLIDNILV